MAAGGNAMDAAAATSLAQLWRDQGRRLELGQVLPAEDGTDTHRAQQHHRGDHEPPPLGLRRSGERYPFTKSGWRKQWSRALKAAGIEDFRFHDLRHTAATRTLRASGNMKAVQKMLGHSDITTTARYAHVMVDDVRAATAV